MCKCYFCGESVIPIIIEDIGLLVYNNVCDDCDDYFDLLTCEKYDYENPDNILYDDYGLDYKFIYKDYIDNENISGKNRWEK